MSLNSLDLKNSISVSRFPNHHNTALFAACGGVTWEKKHKGADKFTLRKGNAFKKSPSGEYAGDTISDEYKNI